ncbi:MAG: hypothetical protein QXR96_01700, partial [Candidatus Woesearchaeota archaeon]
MEINKIKNPKHIYFDNLKKYLTLRNVLIFALVFILYLMFSNLAKAIIFMLIFSPICIISIKVSRIIPHANLQVITPLTLLLSYLYGFPVGFIFGTILGLYFWSTAYSISQFVLMEVFLNAIVAFLASYVKTNFSLTFTLAYFVVMIIQKILYFTVGLLIGGNPMENSLHTLTSSINHLVILPSFIFLFYNIATFF